MPIKKIPDTLDKIEARLARYDADRKILEDARDKKVTEERDAIMDRIIAGMRSYKVTIAELRDRMTQTAAPGEHAELPTTPHKNARKTPMSDAQKQNLREKMLERQTRVMYRGPNGEEWNGMRQAPPWIKAADKKRGGRARWLTDEYKNNEAA